MRERAGDLRRQPHGRDRDARARSAEALLQRLLSNDVDRIAERGAQYSVLCNERRRRARRPVHLPARARSLPDRHERGQPRRATSPGSSATRASYDATVTDRLDDYAMLAVQGPQARALVAALDRRRAARALPHRRADRRRRARRAGLRHRLHGRGRRRAARRARRTRRAVWDAVVAAGADARRPRRARHAAPRGLLPPLRQRPVRGPRPDRGRPRLVLQGGDRLHRRRARRARRASTAPRRSSSRSRSPGRASRARATRWSAAASSRPARSRRRSATAIGLAYLPAERTAPGTPFEIDVRGKTRSAEVRTKPLIPEER